MRSIRDGTVALDTNEYVFALRNHADYPACRVLVFERLSELSFYLPLQILLELQRNLDDHEMKQLMAALGKQTAVIWDYEPAPLGLVRRWEERGAKKGDAVVAAHLEAAGARYLVSENRHYLTELPGPPFRVLRAAEAIQELDHPTPG